MLLSKNLTPIKDKAKSLVDKAAVIKRSKYITTIPGQEQIYAKKLEEALAVRNGSPTLFLAYEAQDLGISVFDYADRIIAKAEEDNKSLAAIERIRVATKRAISEATKPAEVEKALETWNKAFPEVPVTLTQKQTGDYND